MPRFETNDDVAMSMVAHGYGIAEYGTPQLFFSNILWGILVRAIPSIGGILGYSIATIATLVAIGGLTHFFLRRLGVTYTVASIVAALILTRPTLFPQFTINAGLLATAAVLGWRVYAQDGDETSLVSACVAAFFAYIIRDLEFFLVLAVASPMLPWRSVREQRRFQIGVGILSVAIVGAALANFCSFQTPEWKSFSNLNPIRAAFTDFSAAEELLNRPAIIKRYGYTKNDINLLQNWFFEDRTISNPAVLKAMLANVRPQRMLQSKFESGISEIKTLFKPTLLPLLLPALILLVIAPQTNLTISWALCLGTFFCLGFLGRPGILRVYVPVISLMLVMPLAGIAFKIAKQKILAFALFIVYVFSGFLLVPEALAARQEIQKARVNFKLLPHETIVVWGADFPFESAFPLLSKDADALAPKFYGLGAFTLAPFSVAFAEDKSGRGLIERLRSSSGVPIIGDANTELLRRYCSEHFDGQLRAVDMQGTPSLKMYSLACESKQKQR
jgi:NADH:ubiquinone oxidoreductase subunit 3 (subunit A)